MEHLEKEKKNDWLIEHGWHIWSAGLYHVLSIGYLKQEPRSTSDVYSTYNNNMLKELMLTAYY